MRFIWRWDQSLTIAPVSDPSVFTTDRGTVSTFKAWSGPSNRRHGRTTLPSRASTAVLSGPAPYMSDCRITSRDHMGGDSSFTPVVIVCGGRRCHMLATPFRGSLYLPLNETVRASLPLCRRRGHRFRPESSSDFLVLTAKDSVSHDHSVSDREPYSRTRHSRDRGVAASSSLPVATPT